jgi:hypothetical protein
MAGSTVYPLPAKVLAAKNACFRLILPVIALRLALSSNQNFRTIDPSSEQTSKASGCWMIFMGRSKRGPDAQAIVLDRFSELIGGAVGGHQRRPPFQADSA